MSAFKVEPPKLKSEIGPAMLLNESTPGARSYRFSAAQARKSSNLALSVLTVEGAYGYTGNLPAGEGRHTGGLSLGGAALFETKNSFRNVLLGPAGEIRVHGEAKRALDVSASLRLEMTSGIGVGALNYGVGLRYMHQRRVQNSSGLTKRHAAGPVAHLGWKIPLVAVGRRGRLFLGPELRAGVVFGMKEDRSLQVTPIFEAGLGIGLAFGH